MKAKKLLVSAAALTLTLGLMPAQAQIANPAPAVGEERLALTIADFLKFQENLSTMRAAALSSPALGVLLSSSGVYTLFAPTNDAFSKITQTQLNRIVTGRASLGHYVVRGAFTTEILREMLRARGGQMNLPTIGGNPLPFTLDGQGNIVVGGVALIGDEQIVGNGAIIPISNVVTAPVATEGFGIGEAEGAAVGIGGVGGAGAEARLLTGRTISDALRLNENLETTRAVVNATRGVGRLLSRQGVYTLFAPTNQAYSQITQPQLNTLISGQADIEQWVVQGTLTPRVLREMLLARGGQMSVRTVGGGQLAFTLDRDENIIVGGVARLLGSEVYANGVIAPVSAVITAPIAQGTAAGFGTEGVGAEAPVVGEGLGVGAVGDVGLEQNVGLFTDYIGRTNEALVGGDFGEAQEFFGRSRESLESAIGLAEGERREALIGFRDRLNELGGLRDRAALREGFGTFERDVSEFYETEFGE